MHAQIVAHDTGTVDHLLKEIIRILLARFVGDGALCRRRLLCRLAFSPAERLALRYADQMFLDASKVDIAFYAELKQHFSEAQIMELGAFIAYQCSTQKFMLTMNRLAVPIAARVRPIKAQ